MREAERKREIYRILWYGEEILVFCGFLVFILLSGAVGEAWMNVNVSRGKQKRADAGGGGGRKGRENEQMDVARTARRDQTFRRLARRRGQGPSSSRSSKN